ncbi:glycerol kinase [Willisornis vidua]|uniref:Glycerol kinase n=1 Tax=Willisornis vidua TaxID=1566151 RepID=A0ABQ9D2R9_9PASS|nr:glycerol kinase [Willisornis vidua]
MTEEPAKTGAALDLVLANKQELVGNVKLKGSLSCSGYEIVTFEILRAGRRVHSKLNTMDLGKQTFRDLIGRVPWDKALQGKWAQEIKLVFKAHLSQAQECCIPAKKAERQ